MREKDLFSDPILSDFLEEDLEAMPEEEIYDFAFNQNIDTAGLSRMEVIARILEISEQRIRRMCIDEGIDPTGMRREQMLQEIHKRLT